MKVFASLFIMLIESSLILACTCVNTMNISDEQHSKYLKDVKAIFYGEVTELKDVRQIVRKYKDGFTLTDTVQPVKFKVLTAWKGVESAEIIVETDASWSCKYIPEIGNKIMVYAYENKESQSSLSINYCSIGHFDDEKMKREYGEGKTFAEPQTEIRTSEEPENFFSFIWRKLISIFS